MSDERDECMDEPAYYATMTFYDQDTVVYLPPERVPAAEVVRRFVLADFQRRMARAGGHLARCDTARVEPRIDMEGPSTCSEGTCNYDPFVGGMIRCAHGYRRLWTVEAATMADLLSRISAFADA